MEQHYTKINALISALEDNFKKIAEDLSETQKEEINNAIATLKEQLLIEPTDSNRKKQNALTALSNIIRAVFGRYLEHEAVELIIHRLSEMVSNYL